MHKHNGDERRLCEEHNGCIVSGRQSTAEVGLESKVLEAPKEVAKLGDISRCRSAPSRDEEISFRSTSNSQEEGSSRMKSLDSHKPGCMFRKITRVSIALDYP